MFLPRQPVTVDELCMILGEFEETPEGDRVLTRRSVHRIARAAYRARRARLLVEDPGDPAHRPPADLTRVVPGSARRSNGRRSA